MFSKKTTVPMRLVPVAAALSLFVSGCPSESPQDDFEANAAPEEGAQIAEITRLTPEMQDKRKPIQGGAVLRGVHPKSHGCLAAEFRVNENIKERFRVGLFASPGKTFKADLRFSNAAVHTGDDLAVGASGTRENGSRGMAVKVRNVGGSVFIKDEKESNQDFLMINTPEFAFRNSRDYLRLTKAVHASKLALDPTKYFDPAHDLPQDPNQAKDVIDGIKASGRVIGGPQGIKSKTVRNPLQVQYFGAAPFLFGTGRAMKFSAQPCGGETPQEAFTEIEKTTLPKDYLRAALTETVKKGTDVCFDFMIQVRGKEDVDALKIDDATTQWPDELANYEPVARITVKAPQRPDTPEATAYCEALSFTPWHSLKEHQPLGSINRLRQDVYGASAGHRLGAQPAKE